MATKAARKAQGQATGGEQPPSEGAATQNTGTPKKAAPGPVQTAYDGVPAVAVQETATVGEGHHSKWWVEEGLVGLKVPVVRVTVMPEYGSPHDVYIYDGDGEGTAKFIDGGGNPALGHRELAIQGE